MISSFLRRAAVMSSGFLVASCAGALFLPLAALFDTALRELGFDAAAASFLALFRAVVEVGDPDMGFAALGYIFSAVLIAVCVLPLALAALIGEAAGARGWLWYAGASGFLAAASPWIARGVAGLSSAHPARPLELRIAALFFLTGAVTGLVYWSIAAQKPRD